MRNIHHLTLGDRQTIETEIGRGSTKAAIGRLIGKDPCGIGREIRRHREFHPRNRFNRPVLCANRNSCKGKCLKKCHRFQEPLCLRRDSSPGACNGCEKRAKCCLDQYFYHAARAQAAYCSLLSSCREGINLTPDECAAIGETISPLLNKGQSVYQILSAHPELGISSRSIYRHISSGVFKKQGVSLFSLKEQVNRKQFKGKYKKRKEPANYNGRRYADFLLFLQQHPDIKPVEMDTVYNNPGGPYIQTFIFPESAFMFGRLHSEKTNECMALSLDDYQERLGLERFRTLFPLLLTDRGSEFEKFWLFEKDRAGTHRLNIFYCDPMQSAQKPHVENNHNYVRDIIPNGKSLACLTQADIDLMFSHINSTPRKNLHGKTPFELCSFLLGTDIPQLFGIHEVARDNVTLKPSLLFKNKG